MTLPPMPEHLCRITFYAATNGDRCDIPRCRESARWVIATRYVEPDHRHSTGACERHARAFAVGLGELL